MSIISQTFPSCQDSPSDNKKSTVFIEAITPSLAKHLLEEWNKNNFRPISKRRVEAMSKAMTEGHWEENGETIKVSEDGNILDGQHRLAAIVKSNTTQRMVVVLDLKCQGYSIDRGQSRTIGQWLNHLKVPSAARVASVSRHILQYKAGLWDQQHPNNSSITDRSLIDFATSNLKKIQDSMSVAKQAGPFTLPLRATIAFMASGELNPSDCTTLKWFFDSLRTGAGIGETDAVYHLKRRWDSQTQSSSMTPFMQKVLITIAWNRTARGIDTSAHSLRISLTGPKKQNAPGHIELSPEAIGSESEYDPWARQESR